MSESFVELAKEAQRYAYTLAEMYKRKSPLSEMEWATIISASNVLRDAQKFYEAMPEKLEQAARQIAEKLSVYNDPDPVDVERVLAILRRELSTSVEGS